VIAQNNITKGIDPRYQLFKYPSPLIDNAGPDIPRQKPKIDTFSFKYNFCLNDTLIYVVMSQDSITIDYAQPLLKIRYEKIMLTCDSITKDGRFVIKQELIGFKSKESYLKDKNVDRNTTPWLNTPVYIEIDTMGIRYSQYNKDSLILAMPPGSAFQPFILLQLNYKDSINTKLTNQSWMVVDSGYIYENGNPPPVFRYILYYRLIGMTDTLDLGKLLKMTFSMTSQSAHKVNASDIQMLTTSINNAGGEIFWDTINWIPRYYTHTIEQRLTIKELAENKERPGFHYIYSTFILDKFIRNGRKIIGD
jgi:hypothetical protein